MNKTTPFVTAMLVLALGTGGCATSTLWEERSYNPTDKPHLNLAVAPESGEVLVQYDEHCGESKKIRRRAYWISDQNTDKGYQRKPVFVKPPAYPRLIPIPLLGAPPGTNTPSLNGYAAVVTPMQQDFELWRNGVSLGRFHLPTYFATPPPTAWRIAVTPFAAIGDAVVIVVVAAAVAAVVVGVLYLDSQTHP